MFHSENKTVIKEGVTHLLGLEMLQHPDFALAFSQVSSVFLKDLLLAVKLMQIN